MMKHLTIAPSVIRNLGAIALAVSTLTAATGCHLNYQLAAASDPWPEEAAPAEAAPAEAAPAVESEAPGDAGAAEVADTPSEAPPATDAPPEGDPRKVVKEAGPIWSNTDAQSKCPQTCGELEWQGVWWTTKWNEMSVCECLLPEVAEAP